MLGEPVDSFDRSKIDFFKRMGERVEMLPRTKSQSGTAIRELLAGHKPFEHSVPPPVAKIIRESGS